ncbi:serine/threonine-protein kinase [Nocardia sp. NPDC049190]|uniref:serine/threonine-protein kinase n=1 Tax=Nocardia sp. NPDC049190 TaxID=3155650 RepID=UPI0033FC49DB
MQPLGASDPTRIGDYRLFGVLGAGGMGRVYLGRNAGGRTVAVKMIRPDLTGDEFRERFRREVAAARRVGGRFTAPVLDADVDADPPWLATGYVAGFALSEAVAQYGPFTENSLRVLAHGLVEALLAVHAANVVHRDLKPSNVLLTLDGPKVIDFGIARAVEDSALTTTGKVIGSPGFMCPEQVTGDPVGPPADVFALGGVLVFAATGHGPFGVGEAMQMLWRVVYEQPQLEDVPRWLRPLVAACLIKDVAARPTPEHLLTELTALGLPDRSGWLPGPALEEVSRRAVQLLDLDSEPVHQLESSAPDLPAPGARESDSVRAADTTIRSTSPQHYARGHTDANRSAPTQTWRSPAPPNQSPVGEARYPEQPTHAHASTYQLMRRVAEPGTGSPGSSGATVAPRHHRAVLIGGALVICVAMVLATFMIGTRFRKDDIGGGATTANDSGPPTVTATPGGTRSATGTAVPKAFVGEWKGVAKDGLGSYDIVLILDPGNVGERIGSSTNTGQVVGVTCERSESLTSATADSVVLTAELTVDGGGCNDEGTTSRLALRPDGTLSYRTRGVLGDMTGILSRTT